MNHKNGLVALSVLATLTVSLSIAGCSSSNGGPSPTPTSTSSAVATTTPTGPTADQIKAVIDSVTLKKNAALYECPANLKDPKTSLLSIDDYSELGPRANSFAFNVPLPSGTAAERFTAWQGYNCVNELQGTTYAWVLANTPVYGTMVGNIPGDEFLSSLVGIKESDLRTHMMDTFHPVLASNPGTTDVQQYVTGTKNYETFITQVNTLYEQLYNLGDAAHVSYVNWEVSGPSLGYPDVVKSPVGDTLPAVTLAIIQKGVCQPVAAILINDQDQRPERANLPGCATPPSTTPPTTPPPTDTSCTPKPGGTKYWDVKLGKYICKDPTTDDPSYNGHNRPGGNGQAPAQTDKVGPPAAGAPPVTYTAPAAPPAAPPAGTTPITVTPGTNEGGSGLN